jgi:hypothetical protein
VGGRGCAAGAAGASKLDRYGRWQTRKSQQWFGYSYMYEKCYIAVCSVGNVS